MKAIRVFVPLITLAAFLFGEEHWLAVLGAPKQNTGVAAQGKNSRKQHTKKAGGASTVVHDPEQPKSDQPVMITLHLSNPPAPVGQVILEYQIVDPGKYISLHDPAYETQWNSVPMIAQPNNGSGTAKETIYSVELAGRIQKHRRLVRYRIRGGKDGKVLAPDPGDAQPNFAYFVYDGVPDWKGAIDPDALEAKLRQAVTFPSEELRRAPVYEFIGSKHDVEGATWLDPDRYRDPDRNTYKYTGTIVYDGIVYDHVAFRARGGEWRQAMGKNMWKFNFLPGHHFAARDFYGRPYAVKWDKLNLGACIQQASFGKRGEQGMFEAVGFRLFNLAGIEASHTHWVHLRIVDQAEESPPDQYSGDFWGLYLAVENVDAHFLKEHELPFGNLYKIEGRAKTAFNGDPAITDQSDVSRFIGLSLRRQSAAWWSTNVDLARYYNYRSILECIHHYDVDADKNFFYYVNPQSHKLVVIPWDIDLTWGDPMCGRGDEPLFRAGIVSKPPLKQQYQERLAEIRDLLFNVEQTGLLIDEYAAMISDPKGRPSIVDADRAKWDYNPIEESARVLPTKAGVGKFYFGNANDRFIVMVNYMKSYLEKRTKWIDARLLFDYHPPEAPKINRPAAFDFSGATLDLQLNGRPEDSVRSCRWRLAEITDPGSASFNPRAPWKYEIQSLWEQETKEAQAAVHVPTNLLLAGHNYRIRARRQGADGDWSRWSAPLEFTVPTQ